MAPSGQSGLGGSGFFGLATATTARYRSPPNPLRGFRAASTLAARANQAGHLAAVPGVWDDCEWRHGRRDPEAASHLAGTPIEDLSYLEAGIGVGAPDSSWVAIESRSRLSSLLSRRPIAHIASDGPQWGLDILAPPHRFVADRHCFQKYAFGPPEILMLNCFMAPRLSLPPLAQPRSRAL
jgi:hypothetical protein